MTKASVLEHLDNAKTAHTRWVQRAKLLIDGFEMEEKSIPIEATECKFGQWFYGDGQRLSALSNNPLECMEHIENLHSDLHGTYLKIYNVYFSESKKNGFISKMFGKKYKETLPEELTYAKEQYTQMEGISKELMDEISRLERRLVAVSEEKIKSLG